MTAPQRDLQEFPPPQPDQQFPEGGYQPAPAQFPSQLDKPLPPHNQPPGYGYVGQTGYHPITDTSAVATTVVTAQPVASTVVPRPEEADHTGMAVAALVLSIITLICCGVLFLYPLFWAIPALILAIVAMATKGTTQKCNAGISIGLSVTVIVLTTVIAIAVVSIVVGLVVTTTHSCSSYYSAAYNTYCQPYSYYVCNSCSCSYYYDTSTAGSYCPT